MSGDRSEGFCTICGVANSLHDWDDYDPCEDAEAKADAIERTERAMFGWMFR